MNFANIFKFITEHVFLVTMALVSGAMLIWPLLRDKTGGSSLSTLQATQMINREDALLLDVRDAAVYAQGHIINARNIPMAQLDERAAELGKQKGKTKPVIVHCDNGARSQAGMTLLAKHGFEKVFTLAGGISAWKAAGLPMLK
jgi:rhodanese-related sulfurtransferase